MLNIPKTVGDTYKVTTINDLQKAAYALSTGTKISDLEWPWTAVCSNFLEFLWFRRFGCRCGSVLLCCCVYGVLRFAELEHYSSLNFSPSVDPGQCDVVIDRPTILIKLDAGLFPRLLFPQNSFSL